MNQKITCKFTCVSVHKRINYNQSNSKYLYEYEFQVVHADSEEHKKYFASTPSGTLKIGAIKDDLFEPGLNYYLDIFQAQ